MKNLLYLLLLSITLLSCESKEHRMYRLAKKAVRARFKNPDEPKFHPNADSIIYYTNRHYFIVLGTVEATNLLGMPLTDKWFAIIESKTDKPNFNKDDNWRVADVEFESEVKEKQQAETELAEKAAIRIIKTNSKYDNLLNDISIYATVQNTSGRLLEYGTLQATFYDKYDNVIGVGSGYIDNLPAYQSRVVEITITDIRNSGHYKVEMNDVRFH